MCRQQPGAGWYTLTDSLTSEFERFRDSELCDAQLDAPVTFRPETVPRRRVVTGWHARIQQSVMAKKKPLTIP